MTTPITPAPKMDGPHGAAYFEAKDPARRAEQRARMSDAFWQSVEHAITAWTDVCRVIEERADVTDVRIEHTGGGCWTIYATLPDGATLLAGPFTRDPDPEYDIDEVSAAVETLDADDFPTMVTDPAWMSEYTPTESLPLPTDDLAPYANALADTVRAAIESYNDQKRTQQ